MERSRNLRSYSKSLLDKIKHAEEKKFDLRKAIYELDRLSYERGTSSDDYMIREMVDGINSRLELFDEKIKTCEIGEKANFNLYKEIILFFEIEYLDNLNISELMSRLIRKLTNEQKTDKNFNNSREESFKKDVNNLYIKELEKDIKKFEYSLSRTVLPSLDEFLIDLGELLFAYEVNDTIEKWVINNTFNDSDDSYYIFLSSINFFIRIRKKIKRESFQIGDMIALVSKKLNEFEIKSKLLNLKNINEQKFNTIITDIARQYFPSTPDTNKIQSRNIPGKNQFEDAIETLRNLTEYNKTVQLNENIPEKLSGDRTRRYLYSSPGTGKLFLKDIADYTEDSLIFINDWLLIETKKNPDVYNLCRLIFDSLEEEKIFFELYLFANKMASKKNNQKTNIWGESEQYITKDIAKKLINIIESLCEQLNGAFINIIFSMDSDNTSKTKILLKKINIIYDSFNDAQKKIMREIRQIDK